MNPILSIAAYKFLPLSGLKQRRAHLLALCKRCNLKGSILLSPEGINLFVAGEAQQIELLLEELRSWPGLEDLQPKISGSEQQPFRRMVVRVKQEIIACGVAGIDPAQRTSPKLPPRELKRWLDEGRPVTLLDTRNDYEVRLGTFKDALVLGIEQFRDFPEALAKLPPALKEQSIVLFCTGGIRCEKAGPLLERSGFKSVWQLEGGILKYFEECGGAHYEGECFVFDQRTGLGPRLQPSGWVQCFKCRAPLSSTDQQHQNYHVGKTCPYCFKCPAELMTATVARRNEQVGELIVPLPGSQPLDHFRPLNIPAGCDGLRLLDALCAVVPHISADAWAARCAQGLLLDAAGQPSRADSVVRAGQRFRHKFPALIEPDVNMRIEVLYEDAALIAVNKPAPLPMHAGGRFHRNTLKYVLDALYHPQQPRPSHRLDANTTGVLIVARTRYIAGKIQPQFARGEVDKTYLARVQGHPAAAEFDCDAPISAEAGEFGSRTVDQAAGLSARTEFRVLQRNADGTSLLEARPLTGRTNQIRVHLWHLGFPVHGDPAYLSDHVLGAGQTLAVGAPPLCLHAWRISFKHPLQQQMMTLTAPEPAWLAATCSARHG